MEYRATGSFGPKPISVEARQRVEKASDDNSGNIQRSPRSQELLRDTTTSITPHVAREFYSGR